ncbi:hypothetical protein [Blastomonas fulva]|uniref:Uncharacterized protein n=1 Tax=Blastomonas fulva TaxID=1550728 RepID=A0ABN5B9T5_9SPHN|nr:hypothetical protein [Blastomonas fulva]ASR52973.1 hypothetical protein B5J99_17160 [Blastomonas fulva]
MQAHLGGLALGLALALVGVLTFVTASQERLLQKWMGSTVDHGQFPAARRALRGQGMVLFLSAAATVLVSAGPSIGLAGDAAMALVAALVFIQAFLIWRLYGNRDPFVRQILGETASMAFWVGIAGLFLWAAAERFAGAGRLEALDLVVAGMAVHGATVMGICARRLRG